MIGYIKGKVLYADSGVVLLENNGVGYEITCSASVYDKLVKDGNGEVYTYTAVREDDISLYGFLSIDEKKMFLKLITVSGVGPKMGIGILSSLDLKSLALYIATSDVKSLSKVKGVGKKTAERIILELREKITADDSDEPMSLKEEIKVDEDAVIALMSLGFNRQECVEAIKGAMESGATGIQDVIAYSLKNMR